MLKKVLLVVVLVVVAFLGFVATRPAEFKVERSASISAPVDVTLAQINDFHLWNAWSPWDNLDPAMTRTFSGAPSGVGAVYEWKGNDKVGEGRMTITEASATSTTIKLEFIKPWTATNTTKFTAEGTEGMGTHLTWTMAGTNDFMGKLFSTFVNMDKMVGADFEKGLGQLKTAAEAAAKVRADAAAAAAAAVPAADGADAGTPAPPTH